MIDTTKNGVARGYKAFDSDLKCHGKQYEVGKVFEHDGKLEVCKSGLHFCTECADVFDYYDYNPERTRVCEVIALGDIVSKDNKSCTDKIEIVRELTWDEVKEKVNIGKGNAGISNTGDNNDGRYNTGDHNDGCFNSGYHNTGDDNTGSWNSGNCNTGKFNTGNCNAGDYDAGRYNTGDNNAGDYNTGDWNSGNSNTGNTNSGYCNTGHCNSGHNNAGNANSGHFNTGHCNAGNWNTGECNAGDCNTGDWNATSFSSGVLCTEEPECLIFDGPSDMTLREWRQSRAARIMSEVVVPHPIWVKWCDLTDEERAANAHLECQRGMLVEPENCGVPDFEGWWSKLTDDEKQVIFDIPNFDTAKWEKITGLDVTTDPAWEVWTETADKLATKEENHHAL